MAPFYLTVCAVICTVASVIRGHGFDGLALLATLGYILAGLAWVAGRKVASVKTLIYICPVCGGYRESEGRDESSMQSIQAFVDEHKAMHAQVAS